VDWVLEVSKTLTKHFLVSIVGDSCKKRTLFWNESSKVDIFIVVLSLRQKAVFNQAMRGELS
jgi:hypothetical protein